MPGTGGASVEAYGTVGPPPDPDAELDAEQEVDDPGCEDE